MRRQAPPLLLVALGFCAALAGCADRASQLAGEIPPRRLHVAMINGGGSPTQNYQSHLQHIVELSGILHSGGLPSARLVVFNADGTDPAPDLAVRSGEPPTDGWRLYGTSLEGAARPPLTFVNSALPDLTVHPATADALRNWFATARDTIRPGDTLLLYVTDHGERGKAGPDDNSITLWGPDAELTVRELREMLKQLDPGVRVVALMSQCFSGAFAAIMDAHSDDGLPAGNVCGYFASTADRPAYGCYPENRGRDNVGYSFHVLQALAETGSLAEANRRALIDDNTPDVPLRTSDVFVAQLLDEAAHHAGRPADSLIDDLLEEAWRQPATYEPEIRLLDRIAATYGYPSPRSLAALAAQTAELPAVSNQMHNVAEAWGETLRDANRATLQRFLRARPEWATVLQPAVAAELDETALRHRAAVLLTDLGVHATSRQDTPTTLRAKERAAAATAYRMEVRVAVTLRLRSVLTGVAGRQFLATHGTPAQRDAYARLQACERLDLPHGALDRQLVTPPEPFPPFEDDVRTAHASLPAWLGIRFQDGPPGKHSDPSGAGGAAAVLNVFPGSPAATAGLVTGDLILGPPGAPFSDPREIRRWVMLSPIGEPRALDVVRDGKRTRVTMVPDPYPVRWPALPGPPRMGTKAPPILGSAYRGQLPNLAAGKPTLLFFWATWCAPCKAALPEVLEFADATGTRVVAVTDETADRLDTFFAHVDRFPKTVITDHQRRSFAAYAVGGTPTFVLVDRGGHVASYATGYRPDQGLDLPGWSRRSTR